MDRIKNLITDIIGERNLLINEPMKAHTSFKIGGPAAYLAMPDSKEAVISLIDALNKENIKYFVMGNGSNLLVSDKGYDGVVVKISKNFSSIRAEGEVITADAGALLSQIAACAYEHSLAGFEFASGIPGALGGACAMNAGAYGGEMKDVLECITVIDDEGKVRVITNEEAELAYRTSIIKKKGYIVLEAVIRLKTGSREEIKALMDDLASRRREKQPLSYPSAGSTFKRPEGYFAGKLISDSNLKGYRIGGAEVSEKHAGFIINRGGATASDVNELINYVRATVEKDWGVVLEPEVRFLGEF